VQTEVLDEHQAEQTKVHSAVFDERLYLYQSAITTRTQQGWHDQ
jgi:hypothetical protein